MFTYQQNKSTECQPCPLETFKSLTQAPWVAKTIDEHRRLKACGSLAEAKAMKDKLPVVPKSPSNHYVNFLRACKGEEKTRSPFQIAGVLCQVFCLGVIAQRLNTQLFFDPRTKKFTNNEFANAMLSGMPPRRGWEEFYKVD